MLSDENQAKALSLLKELLEKYYGGLLYVVVIYPNGDVKFEVFSAREEGWSSNACHFYDGPKGKCSISSEYGYTVPLEEIKHILVEFSKLHSSDYKTSVTTWDAGKTCTITCTN